MLSKDAVRRVCTEKTPEIRATLQVISSSEFSQYRLVYLSDGDFQMAVRIDRKCLAPQYGLVEGVFVRRPDGVVEGREISVSNLQLLEIIGNPKLWASENLPPTQPPFPTTAAFPVPVGLAAAAGAAVAPVPAGPTKTIEKISEMSPFASDFRLKAKVTSRSDLKIPRSGRGPPYFSFTIADESGSCACFFYGETAASKLDDISVHKTYVFTKGRAKKGSVLSGELSIGFDQRAEIRLVAEAVSEPQIPSIAALMKTDDRDVFTVRGRVVMLGNVETVRLKTSSALRRVLRLRDATGEADLILAGKEAELFESKIPPTRPGHAAVLTATSCRISDAGSTRTLITTLWTTLHVESELVHDEFPVDAVSDVPDFTTPTKKANFSRVTITDTLRKSRPNPGERSAVKEVLEPVLGVPPPKKRRTSLDRSQVIKQVPDVAFEAISGCTEAKQKIESYVQKVKNRSPSLEGGFVLVTGPDGVGKTFFSQSIAKSFGLSYLSIDLKECLLLFPGHAETRLKQIFRKAQRSDRRPPPVVVFFENLDAFSSLNENGCFSFDLPHRLISIFLGLIKDVKLTAIVIATCEQPWLLHPTLREKVELLIPLGLPELDVRKSFLAKSELALTSDEQRLLADITEGRNFKELADMALELKGKPEAAMKKLAISKHPAVNKIVLDHFKDFANKYRN